MSGPSPSGGGGVHESRIRSPSTWHQARWGVGRGAFQPGHGLGKIGRDGQALAIKGSRRRGIGPLEVPGMGRQRLGAEQVFEQVGPGCLKVGRRGVDQPAPGFDRPPGLIPAGHPPALSGKPAERARYRACLCLILATPFRAPARFGANSCTRSRCSSAVSRSKLRKAFWAASKCRTNGSANACRNPQAHRRSSTQRLCLQTGQSHLSDAPQCRHRAEPDFRATGLISVTPAQCRQRNRLNLAEPLT